MIYQEAKRRYASEGVAQPAACPECGNDLMNVWGMNQGTLGRAWKCDKCGHQWKYYSDRELATALLAMVEWLAKEYAVEIEHYAEMEVPEIATGLIAEAEATCTTQ
mgnify:CR=1 FL=1